MMTGTEQEPRLHLTPPLLRRPNFEKTSAEDYMIVARSKGQVKNIFIFPVLIDISWQNWRARDVTVGGKETGKRDNGGARVCQKKKGNLT